MSDESTRADAGDAMRRISQAWRNGRLEELASLLHPEIVMVFPGFAGQMRGREAFLAGFRDFLDNASVLEYEEQDQQIDVTGDVAVATFRYVMVYERAGQRSRSTGRDLWVLANHGGQWIAVWRTMLDTEESPADERG